MDNKDNNPNANVPEQSADEPLGDRGTGDRTWSPPEGEQGISNRVEDEDDSAFIDEDEDSDEDEGGEQVQDHFRDRTIS
jgi:hypothetical protein